MQRFLDNSPENQLVRELVLCAATAGGFRDRESVAMRGFASMRVCFPAPCPKKNRLIRLKASRISRNTYKIQGSAVFLPGLLARFTRSQVHGAEHVLRAQQLP